MNDRFPRRRGVTVEVLDLSPLYEQALAARQAERPEVTACTSPYRWARAQLPDGTWAVLCSEGVGGELRNGPVAIELYDQLDVGRSMIPTQAGRVTAENVTDVSSTETMDLADFIRTYNDRLQGNFCQWHEALAQ